MVTIEELGPEGLEAAVQWLSKPKVNQWLTSEWRGREVKPQMLAMAMRNKRNLLFMVRYDNQPCGLVGFADLDVADRTGMIWYILGEENLGGKGITTEAVRQLAGVAFSRLNLASVYAWIMSDNMASRRVLEKAGFREAGCLRRSVCSNGVQVDRVYFDLVPTA